MATAGGPDIIEDGLVLALDAANTKSFRGEPTENLFATFSSNENNAVLVGVSPISLACGASGNWSRCNYGGGTFAYSHIETTNPYGVNSLVGNLVATVSGGDYRATISNIGATTLNRTFTFSIWIKNNGGSDTNLSMSIRTNGDANGITVGKSITNEWQRISITHTFTGTCTSEIRSYLFNVNAGTNILLYGAQLEEKSYPTRFVNGTRSTTVAAGGGWADISGNDNHGEILNGTSTSNDGSVLGALAFDGTNDYMNCGSPSTLDFGTNNFNLSCWVNVPSTSGATWMGIMSRYQNATATGFWIQLNPSNRYVGFGWDGSNFITSSTSAGGGQWKFISCQRTGSTSAEVYVNGSLVASSSSLPSKTSTGQNIDIGRIDISGRYTSGNIAQVSIYNRALSVSEVLQNYNATKGRFGL